MHVFSYVHEHAIFTSWLELQVVLQGVSSKKTRQNRTFKYFKFGVLIFLY